MPSFCAAAAIGPTGNPTIPNRWSMPCCLRLRAIRVAPSTSLMLFSPSRASELQARINALIAGRRKRELHLPTCDTADPDGGSTGVGIVTGLATEGYEMAIYQLGDRMPVIPASCYVAE